MGRTVNQNIVEVLRLSIEDFREEELSIWVAREASIDFGKIDKARGMNVCIVTTAKSDEEARSLLRLLGMPFRQ